jgi:23S rRNA (guanine2445-N2)-methyltransferase
VPVRAAQGAAAPARASVAAVSVPTSERARAAAAPAEQGRFFVTAAKGTEPLLRDELRELRLPKVRAERGGVRFGTTFEDAYRACLWTRIGLRVHEPLGTFDCPDADALYEGVRAIDFAPFVDPQRTLAVRAAGTSETLTHTQFIAQRTKDAVVDQVRARLGARPSVDLDSADLVLFVHLTKDQATVYADYSGTSLHTHGFRSQAGLAPIKENLAAALVRYSGWDGASPLVDPMCGSGTLLIEAALWAMRRAPGLTRERFGFERWPSFDAARARVLDELREHARSLAQPLTAELVGSDQSAEALGHARTNAERAGVRLGLEQRALAGVKPRSERGTLVLNPPYGERLEQPEGLPRELDQLLRRFPDHGRALIVPRGFPSRRRPDRWLAVRNGAIECELRLYEARAQRDSGVRG